MIVEFEAGATFVDFEFPVSILKSIVLFKILLLNCVIYVVMFSGTGITTLFSPFWALNSFSFAFTKFRISPRIVQTIYVSRNGSVIFFFVKTCVAGILATSKFISDLEIVVASRGLTVFIAIFELNY